MMTKLLEQVIISLNLLIKNSTQPVSKKNFTKSPKNRFKLYQQIYEFDEKSLLTFIIRYVISFI